MFNEVNRSNTGSSSAFRKWYGGIEHRCFHRVPTIRGGGGEDERGGRPPSRKGVLGDLPQENFEIQDD